VRRVLALLALVALSSKAPAAELSPLATPERLGMALSRLQLPEGLEQELTSGLTNRMLIRVTVLAAGKHLAQRAVEIAVQYDLWDENFSVRISIDGSVSTARTETEIARVRQLLANPRLDGLFLAADLAHAGELQLRADALLNPIDRERMEQIRAWVAQNSAAAPLDTPGSPPLARARTNAIFNRIFEQFARGSDLASAWHETALSAPFRYGDLPQ
jgi:hypothetical protein